MSDAGSPELAALRGLGEEWGASAGGPLRAAARAAGGPRPRGPGRASRRAATRSLRRPGRLRLLGLQTLSYASTLGPPVLAVHVSTDPDDAKEFRRRWDAWGAHFPLEIVHSPYRATLAPLARYLQDLHAPGT
jgi:hypothetical protein